MKKTVFIVTAVISSLVIIGSLMLFLRQEKNEIVIEEENDEQIIQDIDQSDQSEEETTQPTETEEEVVINDDENGGSTYQVFIQNYSYSPVGVTVKAGDYVLWINRDNVAHNVAWSGFEGPLIAKDEQFAHKFDKPGTYHYFCTPHPYMTGTVFVEPN